jgi:multiple sugar transport system substrate-binding protein
MLLKKVTLALLLVLVLSVPLTAQDDLVIAPQECEEPGELTMWVWDENWQEIIGESIEVWQENYCPGAEVDLIQQPWGNYWDLLRTNAAGGDLPDVFNMSQVFFGFYAENEVLLNLQPYYDEAGIDTTLWGAGMVNPYRVGDDGDLYAGPVNWDTIALMYNKDMFDVAGLDYPNADWTWDDFAAAAEALTNADEGVYGAAAYAEFQAGFGSWISSTGESPVVSADGTECTLTSEGNLAALNFLNDLQDAGYMPTVSDMGGASADDAFNMFASERVAMVTAGSWKLPSAIEQLTFDWDVAPIPMNPETGISRSQLHAVGYVAAANSDNPDLAANLVLFLVSDEGQRFFAEAGGVAPANPSPALQQIWVDSFADAGKNAQVYVDATRDSQGVTLFAEIWDVVNSELIVNIFDLEVPVEDAAEMACDFINNEIENMQ